MAVVGCSFDEFAVLDGGAGADECDEVGSAKSPHDSRQRPTTAIDAQPTAEDVCAGQRHFSATTGNSRRPCSLFELYYDIFVVLHAIPRRRIGLVMRLTLSTVRIWGGAGMLSNG